MFVFLSKNNVAHSFWPALFIKTMLRKRSQNPTLNAKANTTSLCWLTIFAGKAKAFAEEVSVKIDGSASKLLHASIIGECWNLDFVFDFL